MKRPLGCLTGTALIAAVGAILGTLALAILTGNGIFSPGALNAVAGAEGLGGATTHADLAGRCGACHTAPWDSARMADRCLACHTAVATELSARTGLHGLMAGDGECRDCHTDHRGPTASLTEANPTGFPHQRTGFFLTAHPIGVGPQSFQCRDCHLTSLARFDAVTCGDCHQQLAPAKMTPHVATYGEVCLACHDGIDSYGASFAHLTWPLVGGHLRAECAACHIGAHDLTALRNTSPACVSCHRADDIHAGRLGTSCDQCHSAAGWTDATIDHDLTTFPLTGRHVGVACELCHANRQWTGIGTTCVTCHAKDDAHGGKFGTDCAGCHTTSGWADATFDHSKTSFPLTGGHANVACQACHVGGVFANTPTRCFACHARDDAHKGAFGTNCGSCHRPTTWSDATFDHSKTGFALTGAHTTVACSSCHVGGVFKGTPTTCNACHAKPTTHTAQFTSCGSCHTTKAWRPASFTASHTFPKTHGGAGGVCSTCHPVTWATWTCTHCHSNAAMDSRHSGIAGYTRSGCVSCHPQGGGG